MQVAVDALPREEVLSLLEFQKNEVLVSHESALGSIRLEIGLAITPL